MRSRRVGRQRSPCFCSGFSRDRAGPPNPPGRFRRDHARGPPSDPALARIVLVAGSSVYKPGEHEYLPGCVALSQLLRQTPGVFPVLAVDWPEKPETLAGARAVVMFFDGGDKHALLDSARLAQVQKLADAGAGLVALHQDVDIPVDRGDRIRGLFGAAWEKGFSQRAHWVADFKTFPDHPIFRGVTPFQIDDGWLFKLRFVPELKGVTPLLRTVSPKTPVALQSGSEDVISWAYERPAPWRPLVRLHRRSPPQEPRRRRVPQVPRQRHPLDCVRADPRDGGSRGAESRRVNQVSRGAACSQGSLKSHFAPALMRAGRLGVVSAVARSTSPRTLLHLEGGPDPRGPGHPLSVGPLLSGGPPGSGPEASRRSSCGLSASRSGPSTLRETTHFIALVPSVSASSFFRAMRSRRTCFMASNCLASWISAGSVRDRDSEHRSDRLCAGAAGSSSSAKRSPGPS